MMNRKSMSTFRVYLEVGSHRTFAAALEWPGWCRAGQDEAAALAALLEYGPRYARVLRSAHLGFQVPEDVSAFEVTERLIGNATTDFGAPDRAPSTDTQPPGDEELRRLQAILKACWQAFDSAVDEAQGKALRLGPRGGGRVLDGIVQHVLGSERSYLSSLGGKVSQAEDLQLSPEPIRQAILHALEVSARGEIAALGPRGGKRWSPRYFARREAWHVLDHVWEIEDRQRRPLG
jgi:hypothetical protein